MQGFDHPFLFQRVRKVSTEGKVYAETIVRFSYTQEGSGYRVPVTSKKATLSRSNSVVTWQGEDPIFHQLLAPGSGRVKA